MTIFTEPKIDSHCHILDPENFPYSRDVAYKPHGQEIGSADYFEHVMNTFGVQHALLVGPNSGYNQNNTYLLSAIKKAKGKFKGIAVVPNSISETDLAALKSQGIIGVAVNVALNGMKYYSDIEPLITKLAKLDMWIQFQVECNQLTYFYPMLKKSGVKILIDHCGRPAVAEGISQEGFQTMLALGKEKQAYIKLSGFYKFSKEKYPFSDIERFQDEIISVCGIEQCIWASDWPYLKAPYRLDYGPMLKLVESKFTHKQRRELMWETPKKIFGF